MGVVNVTPDSFVSEVRTPDTDDAVERALQLAADGATILDIGGESTRPGAEPISVDVEQDRVLPVIERLRDRLDHGISISVDTRHEQVARAAIGAGATIINDMSMTLGAVAGELGVGYIAGHMQGTPDSMQNKPHYDDVVGEVLEALTAVAADASAAGAAEVWVDPGIGFGKTASHNFDLIAHLDRFTASGFGVLVGVSRKGFVGRLHAASDQRVDFGTVAATPTDDRVEGSVAMAVWAADLGVEIVRVHDVAATAQALAVISAKNRPVLG